MQQNLYKIYMLNTSKINERALRNYSSIIKEFFKTDKGSEMIESLNKNIESISLLKALTR